ncbi:hypothetical protein [Pseudoduganella lutea]|uniref:Uncharacterized protein n=1 Tax=Pseudoduganella lutea TaxID=321985 RepID=A0A4P6KTA6_9BURK|nr:hypothetical protein [Pseudoduganella lutea]QBE61976.1 hypothetical protein EWM63_02370 [Pseudoduganella lutea]
MTSPVLVVGRNPPTGHGYMTATSAGQDSPSRIALTKSAMIFRGKRISAKRQLSNRKMPFYKQLSGNEGGQAYRVA